MEAINTRHYNPEGQVEDRQRDDLETYFAELVDGSMRTEFEMRLTGGDLISEDGRSLDEVTRIGEKNARKLAKVSPDLWFEVRRTGHEREEFHESVEMAQGKRPNTMISISDFPVELVDAPEDVGGYNVIRQQTMLRILVRQPDSIIRMYSQSLDRSDRQALEAIYTHFGIEPEDGELLGQRINIDLPADRQETLADELTGIYDRSLAAKYGGQWHAGRQPVDYRNTYDFVRRQSDLVDECIRLDNLGWLNKDFMYGVAAEMNKRFKAERNGEAPSADDYMSVDLSDLHEAIEIAAAEAREHGMSFSACGVTLNAEGSDAGQLEQAGYGSMLDRDCEFISKECPECGEKNVKTKVSKNTITKVVTFTGKCGCVKKG